MKRLIFIFVFFFILNECFGEILIDSDTGRIEGKRIKVLDSDLHAYLGIPYATPPLGELRFKAPQPVKRWDGVHLATSMTPICMQDPIFPLFEWVPRERRYMSEDCLYLNVWVPVENKDGQPFSTMIWIHGGGLNTGSSNMDAHYGRILASFGNVIVASINYRLGAFGFLSFGNDQAPGNMGLLDQVTALKWIHRNIESFGGDRNQITIFGSSAGSISVSNHLLSPLTKGLFRRAILQSGSNYNSGFLASKSANTKSSEMIAVNAGCGSKGGTCDSTDVMNCLRQVDATKIASAEKFLMESRNTILSFLPQKDETYMPYDPSESMDKELIHDVEVIIGKVPDEGATLLASYKPESLNQDDPRITKSEAETFISQFYNISGSALKAVVDEYLGHLREDDYSSIWLRTKEVMGDGVLWCPIVALAEKLSEKNRVVYQYSFNHARIKAGYKKWEGVSHFAEIYFAFGLPFMYPENYTPEEEEFSKRVMRYWVSFAKTGKPHDPEEKKEWLPFDAEDRIVMNFNLGNIHPSRENEKKECKAWKNMSN